MTTAPVVVLDMDGTLLDLAFDDRVWNHALPARLAARRGSSLEAVRAEVADTLGRLRGTLPWYCLDYWEAQFGISLHALEEELGHFIALRPGTLDFLGFLGEAGLRTILATNAHPASLSRKMARTGIADFFEARVSAHTLGMPKEDPAFWSALGTAVDLAPEDCVFVDDNQAVLEAARVAGVAHCFGVRTPSSLGMPKTFTDYASVESLAELIPWLKARRTMGELHPR
jgi:HAD superfamily hydrolase (TIGR01509 family)